MFLGDARKLFLVDVVASGCVAVVSEVMRATSIRFDDMDCGSGSKGLDSGARFMYCLRKTVCQLSDLIYVTPLRETEQAGISYEIFLSSVRV